MAESLLDVDLRFMAAAIRLAERHSGLTGTNPSVGTIVVRDDGSDPVVVGRGITALGGRPHAEPVALAEAGERAAGATAYVTLEPCAHHGRTPPCAEALILAGIGRVVYAASDPDPRVDGRGAAMLRDAGILVRPGILAAEARRSLAGYLSRTVRKRPEVTMKVAVSADGRIGVRGGGSVRITGPVSNAQTHLLRARHDAIMVGVATVVEDDPALTCRLPGLFARSPKRIVLDPELATSLDATLVRTCRATPTIFATLDVSSAKADALRDAGCATMAGEMEPATGRIALDELLQDLAATGVSTVLVEAGARLGAALLEQDLVDRLIAIEGVGVLGNEGIDAPVDARVAPPGFRLDHDHRFGADRWREFEKIG